MKIETKHRLIRIARLLILWAEHGLSWVDRQLERADDRLADIADPPPPEPSQPPKDAQAAAIAVLMNLGVPRDRARRAVHRAAPAPDSEALVYNALERLRPRHTQIERTA